ncbi:MAG: hypothetical protein QF464_17625 [Myxococcota bacterium]|nr:hypothetical protein [Myxococcota bacterium]
MPFDLETIQVELDAAPLTAPLPVELAFAIVDDLVRRSGGSPVDIPQWEAWLADGHERWCDQLSVLGWMLTAAATLADASVAAWKAAPHPLEPRLETFFKSIEPLTAEMMRANAFRREETLRKWIVHVCNDKATGETKKATQRRMRELDYKTTLREFAKAEKARKKEAARRKQLLAEARKREAEARAWRE